MKMINCTDLRRFSGTKLKRLTRRGPVLVLSHYRHDAEEATGTPLFLLCAEPRTEADVEQLAAQLRAWLAAGDASGEEDN